MIIKTIYNIIKKLKISLGLILSLCVSQYASADTSLETIFTNGTSSWQAIVVVVGAAMYITGIILFFMAILQFKDVADQKATIGKPLMFSVISAAMIASPSMIETITTTYFGSQKFQPGALLSSIPTQSVAGMAEAMTSVLIFVQMLGVIAFFRGLLMLKGVGSQKEGVIGKAMTHILGGVLAVNIQKTVGVLARTFFSGSDLPLGMANW